MQQAIIIVPPGDRIYLVFGWRVGSYKWKKARGVMLTHAVDYGGTTARQMQAVCIYGEQLQKAEDDAVDGWTRTIVDYFEVYNIHGNREEVPFTAPDPQGKLKDDPKFGQSIAKFDQRTILARN
ncbi:hypothetical protein B0A48_14760 [Cryoendolithus antarcticus]|uniref:Uncharacterized protein n=1 Tax=Cryoendolithus antarcticus TaxID=1507870 RepID=A0A1V8SKG0_9PEZI|nr:hypothetical protein B0A48_14760 [Cryoendolithus antarcticus]